MTDHRAEGRRSMAAMSPGLEDAPPGGDGFAGELRDLATEVAFGRIWSRPGLSARDRSIFTLGMLMALRAEGEMEYHFPMARRNGLSVAELEELVYHATVYAGFPAAHTAQLVAKRVLPADEAGTAP